jgi:UDP:flavonoid glycosyltransferase YjiC (YdhE family)
MRLVALTYGTEGDTRPVAALGRSLIDAGYEVTLLADGGTLGSARDLDVPHAALAGDIHGTLQSVSSTTSIAAGKNSLNVTAQALVGIANENADAWMRQVLDSAAGSDGLIVAGLAAFVGFSAAEKLGIPVIGAGMIPLTPTSAFPSPFLPPRSMPRWLNRFSYRLVSELLWRAFRKATNAARAKAGLPSGHKIWSGHPMLYGISPSLLPQPADWPSNAWSFITAGPGRRIPLLVRAYLRSFCLSQQISSSGPSSYANEAFRRLRGASITSRPPPCLVQSSSPERQRCGNRLLPSEQKCERKTARERLSGEFML